MCGLKWQEVTSKQQVNVFLFLLLANCQQVKTNIV